MKKIFSFILGLCLLGGLIEPSCSPFTKRTIEAGWVFDRPSEISGKNGLMFIPAGALVLPRGTVSDSRGIVYTIPWGSITHSDISLKMAGGDQSFGSRTRYFSPNTPLAEFSYILPQIK